MNIQDVKKVDSMDKDNMVHIYNGILLSHKKKQNNAICRNMDAIWEYYTNEVRKRKTIAIYGI